MVEERIDSSMKTFQVSVQANIVAIDDVVAEDSDEAIQKVLSDIRADGYDIWGDFSAHAEEVTYE